MQSRRQSFLCSTEWKSPPTAAASEEWPTAVFMCVGLRPVTVSTWICVCVCWSGAACPDCSFKQAPLCVQTVMCKSSSATVWKMLTKKKIECRRQVCFSFLCSLNTVHRALYIVFQESCWGIPVVRLLLNCCFTAFSDRISSAFDNNICFLEFTHCLLSHSPSRLSHLLAYIVISGSVGEEKGNISLEESHKCFYLDVVTDGKLNGTHLENCSPLNSTIKMVWRLTPNKALMIRDATFPFGIRCTYVGFGYRYWTLA